MFNQRNAQCVIWNSYQVIQSNVAEFKKFEGARYPKKMDYCHQPLLGSKFYFQKRSFASNRGHIYTVSQLGHKMTLMLKLH